MVVISDNCPEGWRYYTAGHCYYVSLDEATQPVARNSCHSANAELASITDERELNFVLRISWVFYLQGLNCSTLAWHNQICALCYVFLHVGPYVSVVNITLSLPDAIFVQEPWCRKETARRSDALWHFIVICISLRKVHDRQMPDHTGHWTLGR